MSTDSLTSLATLAVRRANDPNWVDLTDISAGIGGWNESDTARSRPIPSIPPTLIVQLLSVRDGNCNFTCDDNARTHPLFFLRSGEVFEVRIRPRGDGPGMPQAIYRGPATIAFNQAEGAARTFQVSITTTAITRSLV